MPYGMQRIACEGVNHFDTLTVEIVEWTDASLMNRAWERTEHDEAVWTAAHAAQPLLPPLEPSTATHPGQTLRRIWWLKPDCWRSEVFMGRELTAVNVCCGSRASSFAGHLGVLYTNDSSVRGERPHPWVRLPKIELPTIRSELAQVHLLQPPFRHDGWEIILVGHVGVFAGRPVFAIEARRLSPGAGGPAAYWDGFDLFTALVDSERDLLLRMAAIVDGVEAASFAVRSVRFDEPIADEVFQLRPSTGTPVVLVNPEPDL